MSAKPYALYRVADNERQLLGWYSDYVEGAIAMDVYRQTFDDNSELSLEREDNNADNN